MNRVKYLYQLLEEDPSDTFVLYSLGQEHTKAGELEKALEFYLKVLDVDRDYVGVYYHLGKLYERLDQSIEARECYNSGIDVATRIGDLHAQSELAGALSLLEMELED